MPSAHFNPTLGLTKETSNFLSSCSNLEILITDSKKSCQIKKECWVSQQDIPFNTLTPFNTSISYRMSLTDIIWLQEVAASFVDSHLAQLTSIALSAQSPDPVFTLVTVGHLESFGNKLMTIDPPHFLPPASSATMINSS